MDWGSSHLFSAVGGAAPRGLSHNGGMFSTPAYLDSVFGAPTIDPEYKGPQDLPTEQQLSDLGKASLKFAPPRHSNLYDTEAVAPQGTGPSTRVPTNFYGAEQGFASMVLGGLTELVTGFLPEEIKRPIVNVASGVGAVADFPLEALTHVPVPWAPSREEQWALLPDTPEKQAVREQMLADDVHAEWYVSQYIRAHQGDIAAAKGLPQLMAPLMDPDATVLERIFGLLEVGQNVVERTVTGMEEVDRLSSILNVPTENLHPELAELRARYERGEWGAVGSKAATDRFYDELVSLGMGFSNEPFVQMLGEIFTDPIIVAGVGTGLAARAVKVGALARKMQLVSELAIGSTDDVVLGAWKASEQAEAAIRLSKGTRKMPPAREAQITIAKRFMDSDLPEVKRLVQQAESQMSRGDRAKLSLEPVVFAADQVSQMLNSPLRIFGGDGVAGLIRKRWGEKTYQGMMRAFGTHKVGAIHREIGENAAVTEALGYAMAFVQRSMQQESIIKMFRVLGKDEKPAFQPGAVDPGKIADDITAGVDNPRASQEAELFTNQVREQFVPDIDPKLEGPAREAAYEAGMDQFREQAAQQLAYVGNIDILTARRIVGKADADELAYYHLMHWGAMMRDFVAARKRDMSALESTLALASDTQRVLSGLTPRKGGTKGAIRAAGAAGDDLRKQMEELARLTFIGPDQLTVDDAVAILNAAKAGDVATVADNVNRYVQLRQNFWSRAMEPNDPTFLASVITYLEDGLKNDSFVQAISPQKLQQMAPEAYAYMQSAMGRVGGKGYRIGLAPSFENAWGPVMDGDGHVIGYRGWMDIDVSPTSVSAPTKFDVLREQVMHPIRAENMLQASRRKFIQEGVRTAGLDHTAASALWHTVREAARKRLTTPRAFTHGEFQELVEKADIPYEMKQKLGDKGLALLTAIAMEGDLRAMGLTSKFTGLLKTQSAQHGNYMAVLAEKVYPLIRFQLNPIFLVQEWVEPYFFNLLRGVKSGIKFTDEQIKWHETIELLNSAPHLADGLEAREFRTIGMIRSRQHIGPSTKTTRMLERINPWKVGRVVEVKELNYHRLLRQQFADNLIAAWDGISPGFYGRVAAHYNEVARAAGELKPSQTLSREEVAWRWLQGKGFKDPDRADTNVHLWDGTKPETFGKVDGIRKSHVARWYGVDSAATLKAEIDAGNIDEWQFRDQMAKQGMTVEYASRAWEVARGADIEAMLDAATKELPDQALVPQAKALLRGIWEIGAVHQGISLDEFVARSFTDQTHWLDSSGRLPLNAYKQVIDRVLEEIGAPIIGADDVRWTGALERAKTMFPEQPHSQVSAHRKQVPKAAAGATNTRMTPVQTSFGGVPIGVQDVEDFKRAILEGMDERSVQGASYWYREMGPAFASVVEMMEDANLLEIAREMNEMMPSVRRIDLTDMASIRQEITARMVMAWGSTQVQTSPRQGYGFIMRMLDDMRGSRRGAKNIATFKPQQAQLFRMLRDFEPNLAKNGLGPKLYDFIDSIMGNSERSFFRGVDTPTFTRADGAVVPMQPGAMDIWMGRERGLVDSEYIGHLSAKVARDRGITVEEAKDIVQLELGVFAKNKKENAAAYAARKAEYEAKHGVQLQQAWDGSPSVGEYEWMLQQYNSLTDQLNQGEGFLGRSYANGNEWTVADLQAVSWVRVQKQLGIDPGGPNNMFDQNSASVTFQVSPVPNSPYRDALPMHLASLDVQDIVTGEIATAMAPIVSEATGVTITRVIPGRSRTKGGGVAPDTTWLMQGRPEQIQDALDYIAVLTQQDRVVGAIPAQASMKSKGGKVPQQWGIDFVPSTLGVSTNPSVILDNLAGWLDDNGMKWDGSMNAVAEGGVAAVRTLYGPKSVVKAKVGTSLEEFTAMETVPRHLYAKLYDGSWATEAGLDMPIPIEVRRNIYNVYEAVNDFGDDAARAQRRIRAKRTPEDVIYRQEMGSQSFARLKGRSRSGLIERLVGRDMATVQTVADQALKRADPESWAAGRGQQHLLEYYPRNPDVPPSGSYFQTTNRGRGWAGAIDFDAALRGTLYLNKTSADLSTLVHETFHVFARNLQPSAVNAIHDIYAKATKKARPTTKVLDRKAEEWVAAQFEQYMASGFNPDQSLRLHQILNAYASWGQQTGKLTGQFRPDLQGLFDSLNPNVHGKNMAVWDSQEFMLAESARVAFVAAEEEAFRAHYYKRGRTWLERSANHPYLGMYPLSYMWGKVLPELMRFMVKKPFGIDAPFAGAAMSNHVWNALQLEMNSSSDIAEQVKQMPESIHLLEMLLPGNPWNLPVNMSAWARRLASQATEQDSVTLEDMGGALSDTITYAFGPGRAPKDVLTFIGEMYDELGGVQSPEELAAEQAMLAQEARQGVQYGR